MSPPPKTVPPSDKFRHATDLARRVHDEYGPELERFLGRRARNTDDARDLAQNVYLRLMQLPRDTVIHNPQGFMYRIARNMAHELRLRNQNNPVVCDSELVDEIDARAAEDESVDPADRLGEEQEIQRILAQLPQQYQACLLLRKRHGMSPEEISRELGLTKLTVQRYLIRAMAHFRQALGKK